MEKILLEYDEGAGLLLDKNGNQVYGAVNLEGFEQEDLKAQPNNVSELVNLKTNGFTTEEIIKMKQGGIL